MKAAKVLTNYLGDGRKATTIHKRIGFGQDKKEQDLVEITEDFIVIDETSMLDVFVCAMTLRKIKNPNARILFIGDSFQIPSVSAGCLLHDMMESRMIPTTKLDKVFRQSEGGILDVATRIRLGQTFIDNQFRGKKKYGDNFILHSCNSDVMVDGYKYYYNALLNNNKPQEILVLSATKKGSLGTIAINKDIQSIVNPEEKKQVEYGEETIFKVDDYVINIKNTYGIVNVKGDQCEIVNGDMGNIIDIITDWKPEKESDKEQDKNGIYIDFDFDTIQLPLSEKGQLLHGWCLTMHKSQGSSAKTTLIIADKAHKWQLNANLLYTAITRSESYCVVLCQADVINSAMRKVENLKRNTFLKDLLVGHEISISE